jgi:hypothetical protein
MVLWFASGGTFAGGLGWIKSVKWEEDLRSKPIFHFKRKKSWAMAF